MIRKTCLGIAILCCLSFAKLNAQHNGRSSFPLKISILDESISPPNFWFSRYPINPAIMIGTEYLLNDRPKHDWHLTGNLGFYFHRHIRTALFLQGGIGYRRYIGRFNIAANLYAGVSQVYATEPVYGFVDGSYQSVSNAGNLVFTPAADVQLGYRLGNTPRSPELFLTYQVAVDAPLSDASLIPHLFVGAGLKFYPFK